MKLKCAVFINLIILLVILTLSISCSKEEKLQPINVIQEGSAKKSDEAIELDLKSYNPFMYEINIRKLKYTNINSNYYLLPETMKKCKQIHIFESWTTEYISYLSDLVTQYDMPCQAYLPENQKTLKSFALFNKNGQVVKYVYKLGCIPTDSYSHDEVYTYYYNDKNFISKDVYKMENTDSEVRQLVNEYEKKRKDKKILYNGKENKYTFDDMELIFNESGKYKEIKIYYHERSFDKYEFIYENAMIKKITKYDNDKLEYEIISEYDNSGKIRKYTTSLGGTVEILQYDEYGNWIEEKFFSDGVLFSTTYREIEYWE